MKSTVAVTAALLLAVPFGAATAACPDKNTTASVDSSGKSGAGMPKDSSHAAQESADSNRQAGQVPPQKEGNTMPLAAEQGGGNKDLATSAQDVQAQQQGGKTAAAQADENKCKD